MGMGTCKMLLFLQYVSQDTETLLNCLKFLAIFRFHANSDIQIGITFVLEIILS